MNSAAENVFIASIIYMLIFLTTQNLFAQNNGDKMNTENDLKKLSELNEKFIKNYINQDTISHNEIIHEDFICIENSGEIVKRDEYMNEWAVSYSNGGFTSFDYTDVHIRIYDDMALVRSKTFYTRIKSGKTVSGASVYTDTYIKEKGRWWCIQAQITPIQE